MHFDKIPLYSLIKGTYLAASYPSTTARYKHSNLRRYGPLAFNLQIECRLDSLHYYGLIYWSVEVLHISGGEVELLSRCPH